MLERERVGFEGGGWTFVIVVMLMRDRWRWGEGGGEMFMKLTYPALTIIVGSDYRNEK